MSCSLLQLHLTLSSNSKLSLLLFLVSWLCLGPSPSSGINHGFRGSVVGHVDGHVEGNVDVDIEEDGIVRSFDDVESDVDETSHTLYNSYNFDSFTTSTFLSS